MFIDTQSDYRAIEALALVDNDTSTEFFAVGSSLEANRYMEIGAIFTLHAGASNVGKTVTFTFLTKATDDGAVGTWTTVEAVTAIALADTAGVYVASAKIHSRGFTAKYANAKAVLAHADCGTDVLVGALVLVGYSSHRVSA